MTPGLSFLFKTATRIFRCDDLLPTAILAIIVAAGQGESFQPLKYITLHLN